MFRFLSVILGIVFVVFVVLFSVANTKEVAVTLLPLAYEAIVPLYFLILFVAVLSFILGGAFMWLHSLSKFWKHNKKEKQKVKEKLQAMTLKTAEDKAAALKAITNGGSD